MEKDIQKVTAQPAVKRFLDEPRIARLATADPQTAQPHVAPVWYQWDGEVLWVSSFRSTRKVKELRSNPRFSVAIDEDARGEPARGVIFEGRVEIIDDDPQMGIERGFQIYARYLGEEGARSPEPQSWLHDPEHLLLKLVPDKAHAWGLT
jgi:nitroimidazol reductase NimA-like FMN-containing flavoprotein (pyridoxamine 5'-phosphate oxidase superfamily)